MMTIGLMAPGERCEIVGLRPPAACCGHGHGHVHGGGAGHNAQVRAEELGLRVGKYVEVLKNEGSLLLLMVDDTRIALDRRMAMKIMVRR